MLSLGFSVGSPNFDLEVPDVVGAGPVDSDPELEQSRVVGPDGLQLVDPGDIPSDGDDVDAHGSQLLAVDARRALGPGGVVDEQVETNSHRRPVKDVANDQPPTGRGSDTHGYERTKFVDLGPSAARENAGTKFVTGP